MIINEEMAALLAKQTPVAEKVLFVQADLKTLRDKGFEMLNDEKLDAKDTATVLRLLNGILDSEMATLRYIQSEKRLRNTLIVSAFTFVGAGAGLTIFNFLVSRGII